MLPKSMVSEGFTVLISRHGASHATRLELLTSVGLSPTRHGALRLDTPINQPTKYPAEFKEPAVKREVESEQAIAQTARDLGVNENTFHPWIEKYHRVECQEKQVNDDHSLALCLKRIARRVETLRLQR